MSIARVISYQYSPTTKEYIQIELGNFQEKPMSIVSRLDVVSRTIDEVSERQITIDHVTDLLTSALLVDMSNRSTAKCSSWTQKTPMTATKVWRWNLNGLGYSSTGVNGPYETAITMDGTILGNFIQANSITTNQLSSDVGQNLDLSSNTSINLIIKDVQVGGENLIRQSHILSDKFESYQGSVYTTLRDDISVPAWGADSATQVRTSADGTSDLKGRWLISDDITFMTGKEMSFSIWAKNNRTNQTITEI